ncbi:MAG: adaptor protein MecA, partial [Lachnospira sp.]|nr:adaptor protein MecA [Lachnospira sp.]
MEFKKIDDKKFQCLLFEEDLEENNISLDDFFRNDTEKIHGLLDVVMEEARKEIGIAPSGEMISLQLAPQPNNSLLLTVSSGGDDISDMLRQAGKRAAKALSSMSPKENNIIKNSDDKRKKKVKEAEFESVAGKDGDEFFAIDCEGGFVDSELAICRFSEWAEFERFCSQSRRTWGVHNTLYKDNT